MPPRLFDANHSVLVLARGAPITKTEEWQEDGQERRTGTETSGGGFPLVQQPLWFHPWLVLVWDDEFSLIAITVWMALVFNVTEQIKLGQTNIYLSKKCVSIVYLIVRCVLVCITDCLRKYIID